MTAVEGQEERTTSCGDVLLEELQGRDQATLIQEHSAREVELPGTRCDITEGPRRGASDAPRRRARQNPFCFGVVVFFFPIFSPSPTQLLRRAP